MWIYVSFICSESRFTISLAEDGSSLNLEKGETQAIGNSIIWTSLNPTGTPGATFANMD